MSKHFWDDIQDRSNEELSKVMGLDFTWKSRELLSLTLNGLHESGFSLPDNGVLLITNTENKKDSAFQITATKNNYEVVLSVVNSYVEVYVQAGPKDKDWTHQVKYTGKNIKSLPSLLEGIISEADTE